MSVLVSSLYVITVSRVGSIVNEALERQAAKSDFYVEPSRERATSESVVESIFTHDDLIMHSDADGVPSTGLRGLEKDTGSTRGAHSGAQPHSYKIPRAG